MPTTSPPSTACTTPCPGRADARTAAQDRQRLIGFVRAYLEWRTLRSAVRVLQGMDDRMLADIGMSRGEIHSIVYGAGSDPTRRTWTIAE